MSVYVHLYTYTLKGAIWKNWPPLKYILKTYTANCCCPQLVSLVSCVTSSEHRMSVGVYTTSTGAFD